MVGLASRLDRAGLRRPELAEQVVERQAEDRAPCSYQPFLGLCRRLLEVAVQLPAGSMGRELGSHLTPPGEHPSAAERRMVLGRVRESHSRPVENPGQDRHCQPRSPERVEDPEQDLRIQVIYRRVLGQ